MIVKKHNDNNEMTMSCLNSLHHDGMSWLMVLPRVCVRLHVPLLVHGYPLNHTQHRRAVRKYTYGVPSLREVVQHVTRKVLYR